MSSLIFLTFIFALTLTTFNLNNMKLIKVKVNEATILFVLLLIFALLLSTVNLFTNINFTIIKGFWLIFLSSQIIWSIYNLLKLKIAFFKSLFYKLVVLLLSFVFYYFFFNYGQIQSLLPLTDISFGLSSGFNTFVNSSISFDFTNTLYIFFGSYIRSFFSNDQFSSFIPTIIKVIQLSFNYCLISLVIDQIKTNYSTNKLYISGFILACGFLYSYEVGSFGYTVYMWNVLFAFQFFVLLYSKNYVTYLLNFITTFSVFTLNGINFQSLVVFLILNIAAIETFAENKAKVFSIFNLLIILISIVIFVCTDCNLMELIQLLTKPSTTNFTLSYFSFDLKTIFIVIVVSLVMLVCLLKGKFLLVTISFAFFLNPLLLNNFKSNTALLLLIVSMAFTPSFVGMIVENIEDVNISDHNLVLCTLLLASWTTTGKLLINPYYESSVLDATYRLDKDEVDIYTYIYDNYDLSKEVNVISQAKLTNVYLPNSNIVDLYKDQFNRCQYCDVYEDNIHEPNKLVNIFAYREFGGNRLFIEEPEYSEVSSLLEKYNIDLLILRKDQSIEVEGGWLRLYDYVGQWMKIVYENDSYVLIT